MEPTPKTTPKDFFLHLGAMATLYVSAISILVLAFEYIDTLFPDVLEYYRDPFSGTMRFAMASLIIIFPLYVILTRLVNSDLRANPDKRNLGVRKWLVYLTLFVAGVTLAADLIVLINTFLGGDLTTRFALKVFAVLVVIGGAFLYYLADLRGRWVAHEAQSKSIGAAVSFAVLASIIGGFFIVGSPADQRLFRLDQQRVNDLQSIQWQVVNFWQQKEKLPAATAELEDPISGFVVPHDPETKASYTYSAKGPLTFELCATFSAKSVGTERTATAEPASLAPVGIEGVNWSHGAGETCFSRTIDPDRFPPLRKI